MAPIPVILDVDTGIDDALALLYAVASPEIALRAVTCVAGNVPLDMVMPNTLACSRQPGEPDVEVAPGADHPFVEPLKPGFAVHGPRGLGDAQVATPTAAPSSRGAVETPDERGPTTPGEILLVSTGPLTNVALALREEPALPELLRGMS